MPTDIDILRKIDRIHPYPAKFPVDLAMNYISKYTNIGNTVYDPFVGSGTTLLASRALERNAYGTDVNHIAVLISQFKLLSLSQNDIKELWDFIARFENSFFDIVKTVPRFYYKSIDHWFCADAITVLSVIKSEISKLGKNEQKIFCNLVFSSIINTVSNQESDTRYAAIIKPNLNIQHIFDVFVKKFKTILSLFEIYNEKFIMKSNCEVLLSDSQYCNQILKLNSVDLILTSPPYPNTYDLYHKHRMNWLECDVKYSMETEIGSRREYSSLKKPQEKFSEDLFIIFNSCKRIFETDEKANPDYTEKGVWNFFNLYRVVERECEKKIIECSVHIEWKDTRTMDFDGTKLLHAFLLSIWSDDIGCLWSDKFVPGYTENKNVVIFADSVRREITVGEDETVTTAAGTFEGCRHIHVQIDGLSRGLAYFGGCMDFWFAPGVGLVRYERATDCERDNVFELTSYEGTGEGYFPTAAGLFRRYEPTDLRGGWHSSVEYTYAEKDGEIRIIENILGTRDRKQYEESLVRLGLK